MGEIDSLLKVLSEAPDNQIDETITPRIAALVGQPYALVALELKRFLTNVRMEH